MTVWLRYALVLAILMACSCNEEEIADLAQFHPVGRTALTPETLDPAELPLPVVGKVYIPIYSHIYWGQSTRKTDLSATLSIRNADNAKPLILFNVDYYDSVGEKIRQYLDAPAKLAPMATVDFMITVDDSVGGSGANFIVEWGSREPIAEPVMESIMLGQIGGRAISFLSPGRPIRQVGVSE